MNIVKIKDNLVEIGNKLYSATEVFIHGKVTGEIKFSKSGGISGEISFSGEVDVYMETPGILIVEEISGAPPPNRLEVLEHRKGLIVKMGSAVRDVYELVVRAENARLALSATFMPKKLILHYEPGTIKLEEKPFVMSIYVKSPVLEQKAMAN